MNKEEIINEPNENSENSNNNMENTEDPLTNPFDNPSIKTQDDKKQRDNIVDTEDLAEKEIVTTEKTAEEKYAELYDDYLRLFSEFDNFRKRNVRERMNLIKTAGNEVIKSILPVVDDLERAIKTFETSDKENLEQGIRLIYNKIKNMFGEKGLVELNPVGEKFNADQHEAITQLPAPSEKEKGFILDVIEKGYKLNDVIIRYPKVIVYI